MSLVLLTAPSVEPVSIAEAKLHARIITGNNARKAITAIARASGVVTASATAHGLTAGQFVTVQSVLDGSLNGVFPISSTPNADTLVWAQAGADATSSGGTLALSGPEDFKVWDLIKTARETVENFTNTALITQKWRYLRNGFSKHDRLYEDTTYGGFYLPNPPLQQITLFQYRDTNGDLQTLVAAGGNGEAAGGYGYQLDLGAGAKPAEVRPPYVVPWPPVRRIVNNVIIEFMCGYGDTADTVPGPIRRAIMEMVSDWYYNREPRGVINSDTYDALKDYRNLVS
jgi:uncharacterized phiE125 gp8 family phage protein